MIRFITTVILITSLLYGCGEDSAPTDDQDTNAPAATDVSTDTAPPVEVDAGQGPLADVDEPSADVIAEVRACAH